jgi:lipopolysaccharide transport system ATP-binding protein
VSDLAIRVDRLGKRYRLGARRSPDDTLRGSMAPLLARAFRRLRDGFGRKGAEDFIWAFRDVSLEIKRGEAVGIIGRNGAGKSTFLKVLSRVTSPTEGRARIEGRLGSLLEVGTGFHGDLSGRDNVFLNGALLGMRRSEIRGKFDAIVAFAELDRFIDTPVKHYSSGMYMRLAFAVAAHLDTDVLFVDEVLAVGDAAFQRKCLGKMREAATAGRTVLFVSHNMTAVEQLCSGVVCFEPDRRPHLRHDTREAIHDYLSHADPDRPGAAEWINPGGELTHPSCTPIRFAVTGPNGERLAMPVASTDEIWVRIEGHIAAPDPGLGAGYAIRDETGTPIYSTYQSDGPEDGRPVLRAGLFVLRSRLPSSFLKGGTYRLELIAKLDRQWLILPGVRTPMIALTIKERPSDAPLLGEPRLGAIAPLIPWIVESPR